jgi:hypothetical protein
MSLSVATFSDEQWEGLLREIDQGECIPFIGPEAYDPWIPPSVERARKWAEANNYPLEDSHVLAKVAQYLAINNPNKDLYPKTVLSQELRKVRTPNFASKEYENTPYAVLADLPFSIYITTNYDYFMEEALKSKNRKPVSEFCRWNSDLVKYTEDIGLESKLKRSEYEATRDNPLVYHLHGVIDHEQSMVLTERDYIAFVIELNKQDEKLMLPALLRTALARTKILFIGYSLEDITFRVIFQGINMLLKSYRPVSFAVQLPPTFKTSPDRQELALKYLSSYTSNMFNMVVCWSDTKKFIEELRIRWNRYQVNK